MKTNNIKRAFMSITLMLILSSGLFARTIILNDNHTTKNNCINPAVNVTTEAEVEIKLESWMTSVEEFNKMAEIMKNANRTELTTLQDFELIPVIEPWMSDITHFITNGNKIFQTIGFTNDFNLYTIINSLK
ncbi:MAG: hypothetical protein GXO47_13655 [Chlorobi bacterium]|nr:hypothetical protein [Chlorobiota bacterium]